MRTTVGPLPSAVYWRRRAAVLGAVLLAVLITYVSCAGGDDPPNRPGAGPGIVGPGTPASTAASGAPTTEPSFEDAVPGTDPSLPSPDEVTGGGATSGTGTGGTGTGTGADGSGQVGSGQDGSGQVGSGQVGSGQDGSGQVGSGQVGSGQVGSGQVGADVAGQCADTEMAVIPVPAQTTAQRGAPVDIRLKIKNVSTRTCARDVGADLQEIYIKQGARKVWSSDTCGTGKGSEVKQFTTNYEADFGVTWNGKESTRCASGLAVGPVPGPGDYEVFARLGGKISDPIKLTLS